MGFSLFPEKFPKANHPKQKGGEKPFIFFKEGWGGKICFRGFIFFPNL